MSTVINTARFQSVKVQPDKVFSFPQGLIGFESHRDFVLIERNNQSQFSWLQSLSKPDLCFLVIEPSKVLGAFEPEISSEDKMSLETKNGDGISFLSLVSVDESHQNIFVNLKSPIAINNAKKIGRQIILEDDQYPVRFKI
ncbi:MAG: flagellar assembly protein FliW [Candidatus Omnitrophica bacterium]|nr:flagellar assembly protein FliW [Candidatus Omnitrophota bacterium]